MADDHVRLLFRPNGCLSTLDQFYQMLHHKPYARPQFQHQDTSLGSDQKALEMICWSELRVSHSFSPEVFPTIVADTACPALLALAQPPCSLLILSCHSALAHAAMTLPARLDNL